MTTHTSAAAVSARLRRAGFTPIATTSRRREGIRVTRGALPGNVSIVVDLDIVRQATRLADLLEAELKTWEGFTFYRHADVHFNISKQPITSGTNAAE
ncbi:hypothetical protein SEA_SONALI_33 [Arthrobacter phage Sonali]|uniref:Uncharacterized protein n=1 Tax=Arthrobacter phage Sonali TaxID=2510495 RepID=A0A411CQE4_9CAUD|nr:hypothetical protein HOV09_gp33 [Arthrobacter phage Sonali]QAY16145.1 hypothetical protein SEA_SONALI_33 [Arthrobacter phage Sonali]